jgi:hypothetical protein
MLLTVKSLLSWQMMDCIVLFFIFIIIIFFGGGGVKYLQDYYST